MPLLNPKSVAVIGASSQAGKVGHDIFKNLLTQGFAGTVYGVNPKGEDILKQKIYTSIKDIPEVPDLAVIVIPASAVPGALTECGEKGIKNVVIISAGFGEVHTDDGKRLEQELIDIAQKYSITLIGPNCLGIVRSGTKMNASFAKELPPMGNIAVVSQSGAMGVALMDSALTVGMGLSAFVSIGNKAVIDESAMLEMLADDPETKVIGFYLESIKDGRKFLEVASKISARKPIVLLKAGVSNRGAKAASSHTGALAGSDSAIAALCAQTGIHRATTTEEFLDLLTVLSNEPTLLSDRIAIITNAGGPGILATDEAERKHLNLASLSLSITETLKGKLPGTASVANPIDVIGDAGADRYEAAILACREDPNIDGLCVILTPQVMTPCAEIAQTIVKAMKTAPLMPVVCAFMGGESVREATNILRTAGIPVFATPERAIRALAALRRTEVSKPSVIRKTQHSKFEIRNYPSGLLDEQSTQELFSQYGLPTPKQALAKSGEEAVRIAEEIGYPLIAKISSPDILHKTDVGGVRANIQNAADVAIAFRDITAAAREHMPEAQIQGVLIQQFLPVGNEFIVGCVRDASFGPLIMVGLGGIYTELFRDTSFRIAPIDEKEAYKMLADLQSWKLLLGMRGKPQSDIDALAHLIATVSQMVMDYPQIKELDLNPVLVSDKGIVIADAKVVLE